MSSNSSHTITFTFRLIPLGTLWPLNSSSVCQWSGRPGFNYRLRHTKDFKMVLDTSLKTLSNIRYISRVKWSNPGKGVAPSPTPPCRSYWKGSLQVALNYGHKLYLLIPPPMDSIVSLRFFSKDGFGIK